MINEQPHLSQRLQRVFTHACQVFFGAGEIARDDGTSSGFGKEREAVEQLGHRIVQFACETRPLLHDRGLLGAPVQSGYLKGSSHLTGENGYGGYVRLAQLFTPNTQHAEDARVNPLAAPR